MTRADRDEMPSVPIRAGQLAELPIVLEPAGN